MGRLLEGTIDLDTANLRALELTRERDRLDAAAREV
jgi:hypothetical protein